MASRKQGRQVEQEQEEDRSKNLIGGKYRHQEGAISRWKYGEDGREGNCGSDGTSHNLRMPLFGLLVKFSYSSIL